VSWQEFDDDPAKTTVTEEIWRQMLQSTDIAPRRPQGDESTHVEIYLPLQVMAVFTGDRPVLIGHVSSGEVVDDGVEPTTFCEVVTLDTDANGEPIDPPQEQAICAQTRTPGGVFEITRRLDGTRIGPLGGMYRPQYFNYGIGIHGAENVPTRPVSTAVTGSTSGARTDRSQRSTSGPRACPAFCIRLRTARPFRDELLIRSLSSAGGVTPRWHDRGVGRFGVAGLLCHTRFLGSSVSFRVPPGRDRGLRVPSYHR
jgi:hypothetical protein